MERLEAEGKTVVLVSEDDCVVGAIALMDQIREGADDAMAQIESVFASTKISDLLTESGKSKKPFCPST